MLAEGRNTRAGEDTENISLVVCELYEVEARVSRCAYVCVATWRPSLRHDCKLTRRCFATKLRELVSKKGVHAGQAEVGEARTVCQECVDALFDLISHEFEAQLPPVWQAGVDLLGALGGYNSSGAPVPDYSVRSCPCREEQRHVVERVRGCYYP